MPSQSAPPDLPPSLPPWVKYVLGPAITGGLWFVFGLPGLVLAICAWLAWYVYEGYAEASRP